MMVAPVLPNGIVLTLQGKIGSRPYIDMTASLLKHFGVVTNVRANEISIQHQGFKPAPFTVESDWSAASYWFAFTALADDAEIALPKLLNQSFQGDSAILNLMVELGVESHFENGLLKLTKKKCAQELRWDFTDCPDLAQTVAVVCAARNVTGFFTGLESLRIKETDRIAALQNELRKIGADLIEDDPEHWRLIPSGSLPVSASFNTYKDHRMAMAFAPLATQMQIEIQDPGVVKKSYPNFWNDMTAVGFELQA
jgi:3-phosphoshikimate 1-carboxyvinyltransferase